MSSRRRKRRNVDEDPSYRIYKTFKPDNRYEINNNPFIKDKEPTEYTNDASYIIDRLQDMKRHSPRIVSRVAIVVSNQAAALKNLIDRSEYNKLDTKYKTLFNQYENLKNRENRKGLTIDELAQLEKLEELKASVKEIERLNREGELTIERRNVLIGELRSKAEEVKRLNNIKISSKDKEISELTEKLRQAHIKINRIEKENEDIRIKYASLLSKLSILGIAEEELNKLDKDKPDNINQIKRNIALSIGAIIQDDKASQIKSRSPNINNKLKQIERRLYDLYNDALGTEETAEYVTPKAISGNVEAQIEELYTHIGAKFLQYKNDLEKVLKERDELLDDRDALSDQETQRLKKELNYYKNEISTILNTINNLNAFKGKSTPDKEKHRDVISRLKSKMKSFIDLYKEKSNRLDDIDTARIKRRTSVRPERADIKQQEQEKLEKLIISGQEALSEALKKIDAANLEAKIYNNISFSVDSILNGINAYLKDSNDELKYDKPRHYELINNSINNMGNILNDEEKKEMGTILAMINNIKEKSKYLLDSARELYNLKKTESGVNIRNIEELKKELERLKNIQTKLNLLNSDYKYIKRSIRAELQKANLNIKLNTDEEIIRAVTKIVDDYKNKNTRNNENVAIDNIKMKQLSGNNITNDMKLLINLYKKKDDRVRISEELMEKLLSAFAYITYAELVISNNDENINDKIVGITELLKLLSTVEFPSDLEEKLNVIDKIKVSRIRAEIDRYRNLTRQMQQEKSAIISYTHINNTAKELSRLLHDIHNTEWTEDNQKKILVRMRSMHDDYRKLKLKILSNIDDIIKGLPNQNILDDNQNPDINTHMNKLRNDLQDIRNDMIKKYKIPDFNLKNKDDVLNAVNNLIKNTIFDNIDLLSKVQKLTRDMRNINEALSNYKQILKEYSIPRELFAGNTIKKLKEIEDTIENSNDKISLMISLLINNNEILAAVVSAIKIGIMERYKELGFNINDYITPSHLLSLGKQDSYIENIRETYNIKQELETYSILSKVLDSVNENIKNKREIDVYTNFRIEDKSKQWNLIEKNIEGFLALACYGRVIIARFISNYSPYKYIKKLPVTTNHLYFALYALNNHANQNAPEMASDILSVQTAKNQIEQLLNYYNILKVEYNGGDLYQHGLFLLIVYYTRYIRITFKDLAKDIISSLENKLRKPDTVRGIRLLYNIIIYSKYIVRYEKGDNETLKRAKDMSNYLYERIFNIVTTLSVHFNRIFMKSRSDIVTRIRNKILEATDDFKPSGSAKSFTLIDFIRSYQNKNIGTPQPTKTRARTQSAVSPGKQKQGGLLSRFGF